VRIEKHIGGKHYEALLKQIMPSTIYSGTVGITLLGTQNQNVSLKIYPGFWELSQPDLAAITLLFSKMGCSLMIVAISLLLRHLLLTIVPPSSY
jgi:hypothetical protein